MQKCLEDDEITVSAHEIAQIRLETVYSNAEKPEVLMYRLWVYVTMEGINVGHGLEEMLKENDKVYEAYDGSTSVKVEKRKGKGKGKGKAKHEVRRQPMVLPGKAARRP